MFLKYKNVFLCLPDTKAEGKIPATSDRDFMICFILNIEASGELLVDYIVNNALLRLYIQLHTLEIGSLLL